MEEEILKQELLENYNDLSKKYNSLKDEIYERTLENEKLINDLNKIEDEYKLIFDKLKELELAI